MDARAYGNRDGHANPGACHGHPATNPYTDGDGHAAGCAPFRDANLDAAAAAHVYTGAVHSHARATYTYSGATYFHSDTADCHAFAADGHSGATDSHTCPANRDRNASPADGNLYPHSHANAVVVTTAHVNAFRQLIG